MYDPRNKRIQKGPSTSWRRIASLVLSSSRVSASHCCRRARSEADSSCRQKVCSTQKHQGRTSSSELTITRCHTCIARTNSLLVSSNSLLLSSLLSNFCLTYWSKSRWGTRVGRCIWRQSRVFGFFKWVRARLSDLLDLLRIGHPSAG